MGRALRMPWVWEYRHQAMGHCTVLEWLWNLCLTLHSAAPGALVLMERANGPRHRVPLAARHPEPYCPHPPGSVWFPQQCCHCARV